MARIKQLHVNGAGRTIDAEPETSLLSVLRNDLGLTGSKYGCGEGECGACTVLLDGRPVHSCITPISVAAGKPITTIEGLEQNGRLHPVQEAFIEADAMQCAYCTPGMIMAAVGLLNRNPNPDEQQIKRSMEGNVCRCGTYPRIVAAVKKAVQAQGRAAK